MFVYLFDYAKSAVASEKNDDYFILLNLATTFSYVGAGHQPGLRIVIST